MATGEAALRPNWPDAPASQPVALVDLEDDQRATASMCGSDAVLGLCVHKTVPGERVATY